MPEVPADYLQMQRLNIGPRLAFEFPARLLNLDKGTLSVGADADVTVFDPEQEWVFNREDSVSKSKNHPFFGWKLKGKAVATIVAGKMIWSEQTEAVAV